MNDPISGQGANAAIHCADIYLKVIGVNNQGLFDKHWMQTTFDKYWEFAQWPVMWSNMLLQEPKPYILNLLHKAEQSQGLANAIANGFDNIDQFALAHLMNTEQKYLTRIPWIIIMTANFHH